MSDVVEVFAATSPYPYVLNGRTVVSGTVLEAPQTCRRCKSKECSETASKLEEVDSPASYFQCRFEVGCYVFEVEEEKLLLCGVYNPALGHISDKERRKSYSKFRHVTREDVDNYTRKLRAVLTRYRETVQAEIKGALAPLHDFKTAVGILQSNLAVLIEKVHDADGADFDLEGSLVNLESTSQLLASRIKLSDLVSNPGSVDQDVPHLGNIRAWAYKIVKIFEAESNRKGVRIYCDGVSNKEVYVLDSFESLMFQLIDNAIKYSERGHKVNVFVSDTERGVYLEVRSRGDAVPEGDRAHLFERSYRGTNARRKGRGSGLGLYVAQLVAKAHGSLLRYKADTSTSPPTNTFYLEIPKRAARGVSKKYTRTEVSSENERSRYKGILRRADWQGLHKAIHAILMKEWDPIGVSGEPGAEDEYDHYIPKLARLVQEKANPEVIAQYLFRIERKSIGLQGDLLQCRLVARMLSRLQ